MQVLPELEATRVPPDQMVLQDQLALPVLQVQLETLETLGLLDKLDLPVQLDQKETQVQMV